MENSLVVEFRLALGVKCRDKITGFEGLVTGRIDFLYGCHQYCIIPIADKEGKLQDAKWFDDGRCEQIGAGILKQEVASASGNGADTDTLPKMY